VPETSIAGSSHLPCLRLTAGVLIRRLRRTEPPTRPPGGGSRRFGAVLPLKARLFLIEKRLSLAPQLGSA